MASGSTRGYIHIYMDLFDNNIIFGDCEDSMPIGNALLQFIYSDLNKISEQPHDSIEGFESIHPYFTHCDACWQEGFLEHLNQSAGNSFFPDYKVLKNLQKKYADFLPELYNRTTGWAEQPLIHVLNTEKWISCSAVFGRMSLTVRKMADKFVCMEDYFVASFEECLFLELMEILKRKILIKTCKNCGRLFIPRRTNMDYCTRVYTPDGKTCTEVGYSQTFARNIKNDDLLQAYTRAYKAHYARMTKPRKRTPNMTREEFETWYQEAKKKLEQARAGLLEPDVFKAWLKE